MTAPDDAVSLPDRLPVEDVRFHSGGGRRATVYRGRWRQADRYHGVEVAIKQYPAEVRRDEDIWHWWERCDNPHIVPLYRAEHAHGHDYEITQWQPAGSLRRLVGTPLDESQLRTILEQLVHALTECHRPSGLDNRVIIHADIKPENILLRTANPIHLCLADFGSAVVLRSYRTSFRGEVDVTDAYAAHMDKRASMKGDWFSVGMVLAELACGEHLFQELVDNSHLDDGKALRDRICAEAIDITRMEVLQRTRLGDRWADLLNGLLACNRDERWDLDDVQDWLAGRHPLPRHAPEPAPPLDESTPDSEPREAAAPEPAGPAFTLADWVVQTPREMAAAIGTNWQAAAEVIGGARLAELAAWAEQFDPHLGRQIALLQSVRPLDRAVARAMVAFNPRGVAVFRRYQLSGRPGEAQWAGLVGLTQAALGATGSGATDDPTVEAVRRLWLAEGLLELAQLEGCANLAEIHQNWDYLLRQGERHLELVPQYEDGPDLDGVRDRLRVMMLQACLDPRYADDLGRRARDRRVWSARNQRISWFRTLERRARDRVTGELLPDAPVIHALMILTAPLIEQNEDLQRDPNLTAALRAEMERLVAAVDAEVAAGRPSKENLRLGMTPEERRRRRLVAAGGALAYLFLVTIAAFGIGLQTTAGEALLSATLLIGMGAWLPIGLRLEHGRLRRAMLGGWLGAVLGLPLAAALAAVASLAAEPSLTWPVFWIGWIAFIIAGSAWGAAE